MNCSMFRLLTLGLSMALIAGLGGPSPVIAQGGGPGEYSVQWIPKPNEATSLNVYGLAMATDCNDEANLALVVGWQNRTDRPDRSAYIYDHFGELEPLSPGHFYDINDPGLAVQFPPDWMPDAVGSSFVDVNTSGRVVGYLKGPGGSLTGFYLDLFPTDGNGDPLPRELKPIDPPFQAGNEFYGTEVNEAGDILVVSRDGNNIGLPYIFNPENNEHMEIPVLTNHQISFNDFRQVVGKRSDDVIFLHTITQSNGSGMTETFPDLSSSNFTPNINDLGEFGATIYVSRGRNKGSYPVRVGINGDIEWQGEQQGKCSASMRPPLNNSRDLVYWNNSVDDWWLYHEHSNQVFFIKDLVLDPSFQIPAIGISVVGERDSSQLPWLVGRADVNADSGYDEAFILIPVSSEPNPGISVTPTSGLLTTEAAGTDSFDVVLDSEPVANVIIGISSSNTAEGTVDQSSLTFTPANWDTPQTVTITGVDDAIEDGDVAYTIATAAATSTDPDYNGLDADDVSVTNLDDDGPPSGSETYDSTDTPLPIPDNDSSGVASDILTGEHTITNLTVNVDITHQRSSDLEVFLVGPDNGPSVELFNFSGDNNVADFNGTSSLGLWSLEVYDTRKKKKGTLNSWSITVDY